MASYARVAVGTGAVGGCRADMEMLEPHWLNVSLVNCWKSSVKASDRLDPVLL